MKFLEEAYKQKFHLKNPMTDGARFNVGHNGSDDETLKVDDSKIFSHELNFLQSKAAESNIQLV